MQPPQKIFIFGAGDDAKPVATMAALLGWTVIVVDGRSTLLTSERFPSATLRNTSGSGKFEGSDIGERDAVVLMTHSYEQDRAFLLNALSRRPRYIGLLGSRHRSGLLVAEAAESLRWTIAECCDQVFAPIGLDIGGEGPQAIALAVISEIQSVCHGKIGSMRRLQEADVKIFVEMGGNSAYLNTRCAVDR